MDTIESGQATMIAALSFEEALGQLDEAVRALEAGTPPLADAIDLFERGVKLAKLCNDLLDQAELRVTQLQASVGATAG